MTRDEFEIIVQGALDSLPKVFREKLHNIDVLIENRPRRNSEKDLLGLYEGVPLEERTAAKKRSASAGIMLWVQKAR